MANPETSSAQSGAAGSTTTSSGLSNVAQQAAERVREETGRVAGQATQQARTFVSQQKDLVADRMTDFADVLRETVGQLDERVPGAIADYAHQAVDRLDDAASALRDKDLNALISDTENFARRQPLLFLAGSMALGFALARFLKSSARHGGYSQMSGQGYRSGYDTGSYGGQGGYRPGSFESQQTGSYGSSGSRPDGETSRPGGSTSGSTAGSPTSGTRSGSIGGSSSPSSSASSSTGSSGPMVGTGASFGSSPATGTTGVRGASGQDEGSRKSGSSDTPGAKR